MEIKPKTEIERAKFKAYYENRYKPIHINETKCLQCETCKTYRYHRILKSGNHFYFDYCNGNKTLIKSLKNFYPSHMDRKTHYIRSREGYLHIAFKKDSNNVIDHINGDSLDVTLKNLRECSLAENSKNIPRNTVRTDNIIGRDDSLVTLKYKTIKRLEKIESQENSIDSIVNILLNFYDKHITIYKNDPIFEELK